ncbi:hypothetical protein MGU_10512 [Metarhizium guizhouense ARSEF 977]|uniref:Uncharacterized protein n=1 Tax=Metarhizium guizhouense (strain ARSEF 977) TaxID=1276136 RepID=A0A0B4GXD8_METGA|nr:hypothetical protein MGU_10512 [Metarhizium guizhouense ARSEF 977]
MPGYYGPGHPHYEFIRTYWPTTIPSLYHWKYEWSRDEELRALSNLEANTHVDLLSMPDRSLSNLHHYPSTYEQPTGPFVVSISYNLDYTLSYALLLNPGDPNNHVVGFELDLNEPDPIVPVSQWRVTYSSRLHTERKWSFHALRGDPLDWGRPECLWLIPNYDRRLHEELYYEADETPPDYQI